MATTQPQGSTGLAGLPDPDGQHVHRRRSVWAVVVVCALVVTVVAGLAWTRAQGTSGSAANNPAPGKISAGTAPQDVVNAYIAALNAHDTPAAVALLSPEHARTVQAETDSWFTNVTSVSDIQLGAPQTQDGGAGTLAQGYQQVVFVPVHFTLQQKVQDSMPDGPTRWGYLLARNTDDEPWAIVDEGPT